MKLLLIAGSIVLPVVMYVTQKYWGGLLFLFNLAGLLAAIIFVDIASLAIHDIIKNGTVMMTDIHAIFLNPWFLITGAYLGVYAIFWLLLAVIDD
ncbi:hypothetical protein GCM10028778_13090 [Barrientosiimonas marina]|uniref:Transposase n=1 Tax=Lentibacillus kimchii TaxID=1542911 RepID=A0ABW2UTR3_9BACI